MIPCGSHRPCAQRNPQFQGGIPPRQALYHVITIEFRKPVAPFLLADFVLFCELVKIFLNLENLSCPPSFPASFVSSANPSNLTSMSSSKSLIKTVKMTTHSIIHLANIYQVPRKGRAPRTDRRGEIVFVLGCVLKLFAFCKPPPHGEDSFPRRFNSAH